MEAVEDKRNVIVPIHEKYLLTMKEASAIFQYWRKTASEAC